MRNFIYCVSLWCAASFGASSLTDNSFLGVAIGESATSALAKLQGYGEAKLDADDECYYLLPKDEKPNASFMVLDGVIARIDVYEPRAQIYTKEGIGIGSKKEEVLAKYKNSKASPHPYTAPEGEYLTVKLANDLGIIFETDGEEVTSFRLGSFPAVEFIEGCL